MSDHTERILEIISDITNLEKSDIKKDGSWNDNGFDSLDVVECIMEVEKGFQIAIPDEESENMRSVSDLISYVNKNVK